MQAYNARYRPAAQNRSSYLSPAATAHPSRQRLAYHHPGIAIYGTGLSATCRRKGFCKMRFAFIVAALGGACCAGPVAAQSAGPQRVFEINRAGGASTLLATIHLERLRKARSRSGTSPDPRGRVQSVRSCAAVAQMDAAGKLPDAWFKTLDWAARRRWSTASL